ncbi:MAG: DUF4347 domain-containing protein, partial [Magnetococcales bacterium]|nr:DUF4347 domain-containing protein [Magnetococcales bacterium]
MKIPPWLANLFKHDEPSPPPPPPVTRANLALRLEKRLMFDASGVLTAIAALHHDSQGDGGDHGADHDGDHSAFPSPQPDDASPSPKEMIFVDPTVENHETLLKDLPQNAEVVMLDPHKNGVEQIQAALKGHSGIQTLHIVSHGSAGYLELGGSELDVVNLESHAQALQDWGTALAENADILIYGCDVGDGLEGGAFVTRMAELTGADVAASSNLTGASARGGDWILEIHSGTIESDIFLSGQARIEYTGILPSANPILTNVHGDSLAYAEGSGAVVIDQGGNATVTDADNVNFSGGALTVAITANRDASEDVLAIRNQGTGAGQIGVAGANVTYQGTVIGTFAGGTGTNDLNVSFNANATPTAVSALLRNITYTNTDTTTPTVATRNISFAMTDGSGGTSGTSIAGVTVSGVDDTPTITAGATLNYTENNAATTIDATITVADVDSANLQGATISISGNYQSAEDTLVFTNTANITGTWNAATGTMTLTGTDSKANYQTALRSVKYANSSDAPTTTARTVSFQVNDGASSSTAATATINIATLNDAPTLTGTQWFTPAVERTDTTNAGAVVSSLFSAGDITDPDAAPQSGIAIYSRSNNGLGSWQYRIDGGAWQNLPGGLNVNHALLLKSTDEIRFRPNGSGGGQPTLSFYAWDRSDGGIPGDQVDAATRGGTTAFGLTSGTINGTVNAAPVLNTATSVALPTITEDALTNTGQVVSTLVSGLISDIDTASQTGIAIQSASTSNGAWQYSTDGGTTWSSVGAVSTAQSLLLRATDRVRFLPDGMNPPNNTAPGNLNFTFVAWDRTGTSSTWNAGSKVSTASRGLATPFSTNVETADIAVTDLNDAPVMTAIAPVMPTIQYTDTNNAGVTVSTLVGASIADVDAVTVPQEGIAIHSLNNGTGAGYWEFSTDNGATWTATGAVNSTSALLLRAQDKIRFQPNTLTSNDAASFSYYAWDQTQIAGGQGSKTDVSTRGGTTAFSSGSDTANININVAPTMDPSGNPTLPTITEDMTTNAGALVSTLLGGAGDIDVGASRGLAIYGLTSGNGTWQYNTGSGWVNIGAVNATSALLLRDTDSVRFIPNAIKATTGSLSFYVWDRTSGTFGTKVDVSTRGGTTAFSTTGETASVTTTEINDTPTLTVGGSFTFTEGGAATPVRSTLTLSDIDDLNIAGATVRITANYASGEDVLGFVNQSGITGSWDAGTGTLTLTGTATKAQYQTALRSITYQNTNTAHPSVASRTVTFTITDGNSDGTGAGALTATSNRTIAIAAVNDAPTLSTTASALSVTEGDAAAVVDSGLTMADVDDANISGATVRITGNYLSSEDILTFTNQLGITGSWNAGTGQLTLTGTASKADYQTALRSITYQNTNLNNPSVLSRTVTFTITDANSTGEGAGALTASATRNITVAAINDAPTSSATVAALSYAEDSGALAVDNGFSLADVDDANIAGATVQITANYFSSEDVLSFTNQAGITGSWNAATGTLTLTGTATKAQYQTALRSIGYTNTNSESPTQATRTVTFIVTDTNSNGQGSGALSVTSSRDIVVTAVNDAPGVATTAAPLAVAESDAATILDGGISLTDVDDANIAGATVQITGNFITSEDILSFTDQAGITGSWNAATGTLTLSGTASKAAYQAALRSITYQNTNSDNPSVATRTVTFSVTDTNSNGEGTGALTTTATRDIAIAAVNDAPGVTATVAPLAVTEGDAATILDGGISLADVDDANIAGATIQITGNFITSEDILSFTDQAGITGSWNAATGTLTLSGTASKAAYQTALRSITYQNTNSDNPSVATRTVTFSVTDTNSNGEGTGALTTTATRDIAIAAVNDAPGVTATVAPLAVTEGDAATILDGGISLADVDDANIAGATIQITGNFITSEDILSFTDQAGITGSWNAATGALTLSGTASKAAYQAALRSITYQNTNSDNPSVATRTVTFSVTDTNSNGEGTGALTTTATRDIAIAAVNDAPGVTATVAPLAVTEGDAATILDGGISLADVDDANIAGATIQITGNFITSEDVLSFTDQAGITGSWNAATGTLTLSGTASKAAYQAALRSITYQNTNSDNPSVATRTVTFSVTDTNSNGEGTGALTTTATRDIAIAAVNDAPGVTATVAPLAVTEGDAATILDGGISLADVDDANIAGATIQITGNFITS